MTPRVHRCLERLPRPVSLVSPGRCLAGTPVGLRRLSPQFHNSQPRPRSNGNASRLRGPQSGGWLMHRSFWHCVCSSWCQAASNGEVEGPPRRAQASDAGAYCLQRRRRGHRSRSRSPPTIVRGYRYIRRKITAQCTHQNTYPATYTHRQRGHESTN